MSENGYKVKEIQLNRAGIAKILKSDEMMAVLRKNAAHVGDGRVETDFVGFDRCHVLVRDTNAD
jgi:hypothetical protein